MMSRPLTEALEEAFRHCCDMEASLAERLDSFAQAVRTLSPPFADGVDRLVTRLQQSGAGQNAPHVGERMPPFHLPDETGRVISLDRLLSKGPVAVTFHRGHWCPYCRISINALAQVHKAVAEEGSRVVAIMPDRQEFASELKSVGAVPFPILTDIDNGYALSLNLAIWIGAEMQRLMAGRQDLPSFQGNDSWMLPIPATFVVGTNSIIKARFVDPDYRKRMAIEELLAAMRR